MIKAGANIILKFETNKEFFEIKPGDSQCF